MKKAKLVFMAVVFILNIILEQAFPYKAVAYAENAGKSVIKNMRINKQKVVQGQIMYVTGDGATITCNVNGSYNDSPSAKNYMMVQEYDVNLRKYIDEPIIISSIRNGSNELYFQNPLPNVKYKFTIEVEDKEGCNHIESFEFILGKECENKVSLDFGGAVNSQKHDNNEDVITFDNSTVSIKLTVWADNHHDIDGTVIPVTFLPNMPNLGFYSMSDGVYIKDIAPEGQSPDTGKVYATADSQDINKTDIVINETIPKGESRTYTFFVKPKTTLNQFNRISLKIDQGAGFGDDKKNCEEPESEEQLNMLVIKSYLR